MSIKINLKLNVHDLHQNTVHLISTQSLVTTCEMFSLICHIVFKPNKWSDNSTLRTDHDFLRAYWIMDWTCGVCFRIFSRRS